VSAAAEIVDESFLNPEEMDAFVQRGLFRAPTWIVRKVGDTPDDPKFTYHRLEFKGANWFGFIKISIVGTQHRSPGSCYYSVSVFVRQTDGPMFMAGNDHTEIAVRFPNEPGLPMPESLYPYLEAALDEYTDKVNLYLDGKDELARFARQVSMSIIHYLQGARIIKEAVEPEPQDLREDEDNLYGPEEMEQFAQVALDAGYASSWRKANGGVQPNRFIDVWVCELRIPIPERAFSGHLAVFRGTEAPWIIHITLESDQHAHAKYIIGYTHTEPTPKFLDKIRAGAVKIINRWVTGSVVPCQAQSMADEIANYVQAECAGIIQGVFVRVLRMLTPGRLIFLSMRASGSGRLGRILLAVLLIFRIVASSTLSSEMFRATLLFLRSLMSSSAIRFKKFALKSSTTQPWKLT